MPGPQIRLHNRMAAWNPDVVNSYQGAFGPPTLGHYQAMSMAAKQTLEDCSGNVLMLFMPTAASSSKKHLAVTQDERIEALNVFCAGLKRDFSDPRIRFEASRLEYDIYTEKKSTATIYTIDALKALYPSAQIALTMGLDNLYDLPFWVKADEYADKLRAIYVAMRDTTPEDEANTKEEELGFNEQKKTLRFNKFASWNSKKTTSLESKLETLKSKFDRMNFKFLGKPVPTSSSLLRGALYKYYSEDKKSIYLEALKKLIGPLFDQTKHNNPWYKSLVKMIEAEGDETKRTDVKKKANSFNKDYATVMSGGRHKPRQTKKRQPKSKSSRRRN